MDKRQTLFFEKKFKESKIKNQELNKENFLLFSLNFRKELLSDVLEYETYITNLLLEEIKNYIEKDPFEITMMQFLIWLKSKKNKNNKINIQGIKKIIFKISFKNDVKKLKENGIKTWIDFNNSKTFNNLKEILKTNNFSKQKQMTINHYLLENLKNGNDSKNLAEFIDNLSFTNKRKLIFNSKENNFLKHYKSKNNIKEILEIIITLRNYLSHKSFVEPNLDLLIKISINKNETIYHNQNKVWNKYKMETKISFVKEEINLLHNNKSFDKRFEEKILNNKKIN